MSRYPTQSHHADIKQNSPCLVLLMLRTRLGSTKYQLDKSLVWLLDWDSNSRPPTLEHWSLLIQTTFPVAQKVAQPDPKVISVDAFIYRAVSNGAVYSVSRPTWCTCLLIPAYIHWGQTPLHRYTCTAYTKTTIHTIHTHIYIDRERE